MNNLYKKNIVFLQLTTFLDLSFTFFGLGMLSIATLLKNNGFSVECLKTDQLASLDCDGLSQYFKKLDPEIIGLNINSDNIQNVVYLAGDLKKWLPNVIILVGGPLVSIMMESVLDEPVFDMAIVGEGEFSTLKLCNKIIRNKGCLEDIEGLIYRKDNKVVANPKGDLIQDLDLLPTPDYSLIRTPNSIFYSSGRGCPFNCSFCFQGVHGRGYRYFSSRRVVDDFICLSEKYNIKSIGILDDTFIANPTRTIEICEGLGEEKAKRDLDFAIMCEGRIDTLYRHPELWGVLKKAGLIKIQLGIENGNQEVLDAYNKKITLEQIEAVVAELPKYNICSVGNIMIGGAFETAETFEKSLNFAIKLLNLSKGLLDLNPTFLCPYPGTDIAKNPAKYGLSIIDRQWLTHLSTHLPSVITKSLGVTDLMELKHTFLDRVKLEAIKLLKKADFAIMNTHMSVFSRYSLPSGYYFHILALAPVIKKYFDLRNNVSRFRSDEISHEKLISSRPILLSTPSCSGTNYILDGFFDRIYIKKAKEQLLCDFSTGRLSIIEIAQLIKDKLELDVEVEIIIKTVMIPFYKRLEKSYHVIFQI